MYLNLCSSVYLYYVFCICIVPCSKTGWSPKSVGSRSEHIQSSCGSNSRPNIWSFIQTCPHILVSLKTGQITKKDIFNYYTSLEYFHAKIFHYKGRILVHVLLITHQSLPSRHLMKPLWNQCIWWQLKDTLNGNIHNTISFPFNPYIVSSPICHGSS